MTYTSENQTHIDVTRTFKVYNQTQFKVYN